MKRLYPLLGAVVGVLVTTATLNAEPLECVTVKPANNAGYSIRVKYFHVCEKGKDVGEGHDDLSTAFHAERQVVKGSSINIWTQPGPFNNSDIIDNPATGLPDFQINTSTWISCEGALWSPRCRTGNL